jgi:carbonic anhydrase
MGNLTELLAKIQPAIYEEKTIQENRNSSNSLFVENVAAINVKRTVNSIIQRSPIIKEMIDNKQIGIVGGMHNLDTGEVEFYEDAMFF